MAAEGSPAGTTSPKSVAMEDATVFFGKDVGNEKKEIEVDGSPIVSEKTTTEKNEDDVVEEPAVKKQRTEEPTRSRRRTTVPFLSKLVQLFDEEPELIQWRDGSIAIPNPRKLEAKLPVYFRHAKYTSFQRQLNNFGYTKVDRSSMDYSVYVKTKGPEVKTIDDLLNLNHVRHDDVSPGLKKPTPERSTSFDIVDSLLTLRSGPSTQHRNAITTVSSDYPKKKKSLKRASSTSTQTYHPHHSGLSTSSLTVGSRLIALPAPTVLPPGVVPWAPPPILPISQLHVRPAY